MATTISRTKTTKIIDDIGEIKRIALKLLSHYGEITPGTIWSAGRVTYSNAQKAIDELEADGRISRFTKSEQEESITAWKKNGGAV